MTVRSLSFALLDGTCNYTADLGCSQYRAHNIIYSLLSIPRISRDWAKYVELSVVRGNQIMTYTYHFGAK